MDIPAGFAMPSGGFIYTRVTFLSELEPRLPHRVLKKVHGGSEQTCVLELVSLCDGFVYKAGKNAISEVAGADDIIIR